MAKLRTIQLSGGEQSYFDFEVQYRPGRENLTADCFIRAHFNAFTDKLKKLREFHDGLRHPGISRLTHFVRSRNVPYSSEEARDKLVQNMCWNQASLFQAHQPTSHQINATVSTAEHWIQGSSALCDTQSISSCCNWRVFPFVCLCKDMTFGTVVRCLDELFAVFYSFG